MDPQHNARRLRRWQTQKEKQFWHAWHRRTGCLSVEKKEENLRFLPPKPLSPTLSPLVPRGAREKKRAAVGWQAIKFRADRCANRAP